MDQRVWTIKNTTLHKWFERDRKHVELRDKQSDATIIEFWDDDVEQMFEDGFLDMKRLHESAVEYSNYVQPMGRCQCKDPNCECEGKCNMAAFETVYKVEEDNETGTAMCNACADDAYSSGVFDFAAPVIFSKGQQQ